MRYQYYRLTQVVWRDISPRKKNGFLIDFNDAGKAYAQKINDILSEKGRYETLSKSTREEYDKRLNWSAWADSFKEVVKKLFNN